MCPPDWTAGQRRLAAPSPKCTPQPGWRAWGPRASGALSTRMMFSSHMAWGGMLRGQAVYVQLLLDEQSTRMRLCGVRPKVAHTSTVGTVGETISPAPAPGRCPESRWWNSRAYESLFSGRTEAVCKNPLISFSSFCNQSLMKEQKTLRTNSREIACVPRGHSSSASIPPRAPVFWTIQEPGALRLRPPHGALGACHCPHSRGRAEGLGVLRS